MDTKMGKRGVTRPMMHEHQQEDGHPAGHDQHNDQQHKMTPEQRKEMLQMHHNQTLWIYWLVVILGVWVILSPLTFDYGKNPVVPSGGRSVWLSLDSRILAMKWSDIISGALLVIFGYRSLTPNRPISLWICCFVGVWLSIAPLLFWSPTAVAYLNDTLVGALVVALTILIPGMPNMIIYMEMGPDTPPGWSYNPSSWPQRWIMIVTGLMGWLVSRYLAAFQLGYIDTIWDPFFGESTRRVLNSAMSHSLPVSDAGLGSLAYTFEFLMGFMGSPARWRTMPWMVTFFGILVIPLGLVHIFLVISQPLAVGYWCTFCLLAAAIMLPMIPLEVDEVIAMVQYMKKQVRKGESFWKVFWKGGGMEDGDMDQRTPDLMKFPQEQGHIFRASIWGMSFPWTLVLSMLLGIWLVFSPAVFGVAIQTPAAGVNHLGGALIVVVSVVCMGEVLRIGRYLNILLGLAVAVSIWFTGNTTAFLSISSLVSGVLVALLALPRGPKTETYGGWDEYVR
ncbi:hypothetical protein GCM10023187_14080 [Nibrella viscosa]|uniref:Vitamin K epoxide reductase family protein n=1 Tax=Nibrella viscosa TaxID=1084524 RepID=A0ABP8K4X3_9BACT